MAQASNQRLLCSISICCVVFPQTASHTYAQPRSTAEAETLERTHVHAVYNHIASHFSHTRHSAWPSIDRFLTQLPSAAAVADVGCGNAKYWPVNPALKMWGCDISEK